MNLLLDTNALLWWLADEPMDPEAAAAIADPNSPVAVSAATIWEIAVKQAIGKVRVEGSVLDQVERGGFEPLPISWEHADRAGQLPPHHRDPFDRMLVAQAQAEGLRLVSRDAVFALYEVDLLRC